ncbi:hypothetical protein AB0B28_16710 [Glycomyces sp. NPDC046736]|uniref:hypothetical protein n=1 Tax=Glycomyces sp. NPDC046736 TaxID=3155615 RepID=UPI00340B6C07
MSMHDPNALTPAEAAWLRDPRHPVNNGFQLHPVPNLIIPNPRHFSIVERNRYVVTRWVRDNVILAHYTPIQRFLLRSGSIALDWRPMKPPKEPTWKQLAELYGVVVTPEEARRYYRPTGWIAAGLIWGAVLFFLAVLLLVRFAGGAE